MAQVLKPTPVAQVDANSRIQAHSGGTSRLRSHPSPLRWHKPTLVATFKPAPAAKLFVFSDFFALSFRKVLFVFCILSPPRVAQSRLLQSQLKVRSAWHKVDYCSRISKSAPHDILKSTSKVAYQSPLRAAQSRLRFSSRILKSALPASKVDFGRI
jgi:hypothetical protein